MVQPRVVADLEEGPDRAGFGIVAAVNEASDAGIDDRAGAHGARLKRDRESAFVKPPMANERGRFPQRQNFRVGGRVGVAFAAVMASPDYFSRRDVEDDAADRNFVQRESSAGFGDRLLHEEEVGHWTGITWVTSGICSRRFRSML